MSAWPLPFRQLTGDERRMLRDIMREGSTKQSLTLALSDATPSRDFEQIVSNAPYDTQLYELIRRAEREGWLDALIAAFCDQTERPDLDDAAGRIGALARERAQRGFVTPKSSRRAALYSAGGAAALAILLGAGIYIVAPFGTGRAAQQFIGARGYTEPDRPSQTNACKTIYRFTAFFEPPKIRFESDDRLWVGMINSDGAIFIDDTSIDPPPNSAVHVIAQLENGIVRGELRSEYCGAGYIRMVRYDAN